MPTGVSKDIIFLLGGILLSFALETQRRRLDNFVSDDSLGLISLAVFALLTGGYLVFRHYHNVLSAAAGQEGSARRKAYDDLRTSLSEGGSPAMLYTAWLERALHLAERFFGDEPPATRSLVQHVIGLSRPAALWTAPALDRCILLSFFYPQALLILGWVATGNAGPVEKLLGLVPDHDYLGHRLPTMVAIAIALYAYSKSCGILRRGKIVALTPPHVHWIRFILWQIVFGVASLAVAHFLGHDPNSVGGSIILSSSVVGAVAGDVLLGIASGIAGAIVGMSIMALDQNVFVAALAAAVACMAVGYLHAALGSESSAWGRLRLALRHSYLFWGLFLFIAAAFYIGLARFPPRSSTFPVLAPILLYCGLLPTLNAPFLWLSVGITRAFLWLGLEKKGWWPYIFALVDAALAVVMLVLLVAIMVVGVQTLNLMAVYGGEKPILALDPLLRTVNFGAKGSSFQAADWWAYTLMFLAMVPSLMNLAIGGFSLLRGIPTLSGHLYSLLPQHYGVAPHDRNRIALTLSLQAMAGISLAFAWQFILLPSWIFGHVMPGLGFGVLQFAQQIEKFNLPAQIW
jgi:hypothetical protein